MPLSAARNQLSAMINQVAHGKDRIVLESHGRPKAALVSIEDLDRLEAHEDRHAEPEAEMVYWLEQTERTLLEPQGGVESTNALLEVRENRVAEEAGEYRRKRRSQAGSQRKR